MTLVPQHVGTDNDDVDRPHAQYDVTTMDNHDDDDGRMGNNVNDAPLVNAPQHVALPFINMAHAPRP